MTPERRAELAAAYEATLYRADLPEGPITIRVGRPCPELNELLDAWLVSSWAFLTACNPGSRRLSDEENAERTALLASALSLLGKESFRGEGTSPDGEWHEASFFVIDITETLAANLARQFGQLAFVFGERGPARLVWVE